ncbi:Calcium-binding mitochondrial carrier protein Aralar2 [Ceratocystis fimbriata CBS 114723]|uniref:Mitochondrial aspartate-glutamate transporter AGC1 n=1 Tax=Ceratocystis fimbriata CBS 114723 TaxID=1035309 RepID=A0A2C5X4Y4_9PEZI|nr:Calcium-binding mitochondrial carrier protein Aralar2 [Ceratocystis fimbriata CBS 114723]
MTALPPSSSSSQAVLARFEAAAIKDEAGQLFIGPEQFVNAIAPAGEDYHRIHRDQYALLFHAADRQKTGKLSLADWELFESLLAKPDAEYQIAFRLFDVGRSGHVSYEDFKNVLEANRSPDSLPLSLDSQWMRLHLGTSKQRHDMDYPQFAQLLRGMQGERIRQAFVHFDPSGTGFITPADFERIVRETSRHKLSDYTLTRLSDLCENINGSGAASKISYATVRAFRNVIDSIDLIEKVVVQACAKSPDGKISRDDFFSTAALYARFQAFTPAEVDVLFRFASADSKADRLTPADFRRVVDSSWRKPVSLASEAVEKAKKDSQLSWGQQVLVSSYNFVLGSMAGAFGAFMVYPIDLVKTRMQNQRTAGPAGNALYKNSIDCFQKVIRNEGFLGLYSGVLPQLVGVAPEKAIKLTVNDLARGYFSRKDGSIHLGAEIISGSTAGACQVVFTNPLEIVKIRLQVQGEASKTNAAVPKRSAMWIIRNLGFLGLYKGALACLLRDVPFSAIYFPAYSHLKRDFFNESPSNPLGVLQLLTAGAIAGIPAAYLTTPCDVIKTRLQVEARKGDVQYTGLRDAAKKIWQQEGFRAFFKGGPARIFRSSPQFGFTLAAYEVLHKALPLPSHLASRKEVSYLGDEMALYAPFVRSRNALKAVLDLDENFGRVAAPDAKAWKVLDKAVEAVYS